MVVPLPQDDPDPRPPPAIARSRPISSASAAPTSRRGATTTPISATSTGCAAGSRRSISRGITLVCQDWGGLIGLRLAAEHADRFARVVAANTFLPTGDTELGEAFHAWRKFSQEVPEFPVGTIVQGGCTHDAPAGGRRRLRRAVPRRELQGGRAPVPDARAVVARRSGNGAEPQGVAGPAALAEAVPHRVQRCRSRSRAAPIASCRSRSPAPADQPHTTIAGGGHFLQEDRGEELARVVVDFMARTR